jgi:hypothetical protein
VYGWVSVCGWRVVYPCASPFDSSSLINVSSFQTAAHIQTILKHATNYSFQRDRISQPLLKRWGVHPARKPQKNALELQARGLLLLKIYYSCTMRFYSVLHMCFLIYAYDGAEEHMWKHTEWKITKAIHLFDLNIKFLHRLCPLNYHIT